MFKKVTFLSIYVLCFFCGFAQVESGDKFLGGSMSFSRSNAAIQSINGFEGVPLTLSTVTLSPKAGLLVSDNVAIGAAINYSFQKANQTLDGLNRLTITQNLVGIEPFTKIYWKLADKAGFMMDISAGFSFGKQNSELTSNSFSLDGKNSLFNLRFGLNPKLYYFVTPRIGLEASIGDVYYQLASVKGESGSFQARDEMQTTFVADFGTGLTLSFKYYFGSRLSGNQ